MQSQRNRKGRNIQITIESVLWQPTAADGNDSDRRKTDAENFAFEFRKEKGQRKQLLGCERYVNALQTRKTVSFCFIDFEKIDKTISSRHLLLSKSE